MPTVMEILHFMLLQMSSVLFLQSWQFLDILHYYVAKCIGSKPLIFLTAASPDLLSRNRFEEILRYLHLADNAKLIQVDKVAKIRPFHNMMNQRFLSAFQFN